jgi:hypothetical protein
MRVTHLFDIFWFIYFISLAQSTSFHLGLKAEFYGYTHQEISSLATYRKEFWISPLPAMYVVAVYDLSESISVFVKPGLSFRPATGNFEAGLGLIYKISNHDYFLTSGVNTYFNRVAESKSNIYFIFLGIGYQITNRLALDLTLHQGLNQDIAFYRTEKPDGPSKLHNMVKFGVAATY